MASVAEKVAIVGTLENLIDRCESASARMSVKNPNRTLLRDMAVALVTQARWIADLQKAAEDKPRIVLP